MALASIGFIVVIVCVVVIAASVCVVVIAASVCVVVIAASVCVVVIAGGSAHPPLHVGFNVFNVFVWLSRPALIALIPPLHHR